MTFSTWFSKIVFDVIFQKVFNVVFYVIFKLVLNVVFKVVFKVVFNVVFKVVFNVVSKNKLNMVFDAVFKVVFDVIFTKRLSKWLSMTQSASKNHIQKEYGLGSGFQRDFYKRLSMRSSMKLSALFSM